jgi:glycosyltransferase involved in cell wall biosynthesis
MRFHVLGVSFAPTNKEYSCEGFSQKVRLFCKMMTERGHTVYHYGVEGSNPICTENIDVVSKETYNKTHKSYDYKERGFLYHSETEPQDEFNYNAILQINKRKQQHDFLCFSFGFPQRPIYEAHSDLTACEIGIGFEGSFAPYRIFESYAWMHVIYGRENKLHSSNFYDAVISNYYDLDDYIYSEEKDDYFFYIARQDPSKGLEIALRSAEYAGCKLITAGVGTPYMTSPNLIHVGVVDFEQRAKLMSRARATFVPTNYIEPFGSTVLESMLCGTPVISTDFGAFTETVTHGVTGYRCRTLEQFFWATKNINNIKPIDCRNFAVNNNSIYVIGEKYEEYFSSLYKLSINPEEGWYQKNLDRKNLNWLNKYIPEVEKIKEDDRPNLCFFVDINDINNEFIKMSENFSKKYRVLVFSESYEEIVKNNIEYLHIKRYNEFQKNNIIDITIVLKRIFYLIEFEIKSNKTFIWLQNDHINPEYYNVIFPNKGKGLLKNLIHKIDGIITSSELNMNNIIDYYDINYDKVYFIDKEIEWYILFKKIKKNE